MYSEYRRSSFVPQYSTTRDTDTDTPKASRVVLRMSTIRRGEQVYKWRNELTVPDIRIGQERSVAETAFR